jgi:predicted ArsR family transcriptional regulator
MLPAQPVRERVLDFMKSNPTAWRAKTLAAKLGIKMEPLRQELLRLQGEGKLVSCTVSAPNRQPQEEYRIAANALAVDLRKFVISSKKAQAPRPSSESKRAARKSKRTDGA